MSGDEFIQPLFAVQGLKNPESIPGLTGVARESEHSLLTQIEQDLENGVRSFLLFGVPESKRESGFDFTFPERMISTIKKRFGSDLFLAVDVCLCSYTSHGQCGFLSPEGDHVDNSTTVAELARAASIYAAAGADCVAPSDMMDGRVAAIRRSLDQVGRPDALILSYSAKFHSKFYGPFRVAADSAPKGTNRVLTDRSTYQIDPARPSDALLSSRRDADEGADILMVKPALAYLDVLAKLSAEIPLPWAAYEVSGEWAGIELLAERNLVDGPRAHLESWTAIRRAGAEIIISYGARRAREWIQKYGNAK